MKKIYLVLIIVGVVLLVLLAIIYLIFYNRKWRGRWLTYENSRFGFSVDYPIDWQLGEAPMNNDGREITSPDGKTICRAYGFANALISDSGKPQTLDEYIDWMIQSNADAGVAVNILERKDSTLNNKRAVYLYLDEDSDFQDAIYTLDEETGYGITCIYPDAKSRDDNKKIFDHLVESMKIEK